MDTTNDKHSIKNLLFAKAIPNYVIPIPTSGHRVYPCTDCGDKYILESSFQYHINRKSVQITYMCRHCSRSKIFYNRCKLLSHIRSHGYKTATINVADLKIEPLPLKYFKMNALSVAKKTEKTVCYDCKEDITATRTVYKDRAEHYMQYTNEVHTCPICLFALPTSCGLKAHLRIHLKIPPYFCSECGIHLPNKSIFYPYNHDCEGFRMMRATARLKCPIPECHLFHPNELKQHLKDNHLKKVFKCPFCYVACFNEYIMVKHLRGHITDSKPLVFYQCEMCPGRLVLQNQADNHLKGHVANNMFPCWACGTVFKEVRSLIEHHTNAHGLSTDLVKSSLQYIPKPSEPVAKQKRIYRVVKRCDQCRRSFTYKCKYEQIQMLPNECPYKCTSSDKPSTQEILQDTNTNLAQIICHMCKTKMSQNWEEIKNHYATHHKTHRCVDVEVIVEKMNIEKLKIIKRRRRRRKNTSNAIRVIRKRGPRRNKNRQFQMNTETTGDVNPSSTSPTLTISGELACNLCGTEFQDKQLFEVHLLDHRDPCMAYQCMECGQCFVVKPSFSTHLLLEHGISDAQDYICKKQCYNDKALMKYQQGSVNNEPLRENQCRICRDQFDSSSDLEKHFRVHGMAFLMKNNSNKNISP